MHNRPAPLVAGCVSGAVLAAVAVPVRAQPVPDYDFQWSTIGSPGNRAANAEEAPAFYWPPPLNPPGGWQVGSVGYEFRMSRTEVTTAQWFEFVQAYTPYYTGLVNDPSFTSGYIRATNFEGGDPGYVMNPGTEQFAAEVSWRFAARYVYLLSNGKDSAQWAFESGAYDTSTFTRNPDGSFNDQLTHSPGATFWLPTLDEWIKGMHFDPQRYGEGQEGYWYYPHSSDIQPIPGYPEDGGQTLSGVPPFMGPDLPVGSYPDVQSPWGLLDGTGGAGEWTEFTTGERSTRAWKGTGNFSGTGPLLDGLDFIQFTDQTHSRRGIRLASIVPAPTGLVVFTISSLIAFQLRRRRL